MNDLSLFIYFVGISGGVKALLVFVAFVALIFTVVEIVRNRVSHSYADSIRTIVNDLNRTYRAIDTVIGRQNLIKEITQKIPEAHGRFKTAQEIRNLFLASSLFLLPALIPSERVLWMLAASEMGEELVQTEEFDKLRVIINQKLDQYTLADEEGET